MAEVNPYLTFVSNCEEAFNFYKAVFQREFLTLMRFGDVPSDYQSAESESHKIMHVALPLGKNSVLMGSDTPEGMGKVIQGTNLSIAIETETEDEATRLFNGLAIDGTVTMPLGKVFWGAYFGMLTDKFGTQWLVSYTYK